MNFYKHHIGDYAQATAHLSFVEDAAYSRLIRKYYAEERPLPADLKQVQRLVGARSREEREAVETVLGEFFTLEEDGWHQARCDAEIAVASESQGEHEIKKANERERQRRHRERRKQLFDALREHGEVPSYDTTIDELVAMLSRVTQRDTSRDVTEPVTRDATANQTPDTRHQTPDKNIGASTASSAPQGPGIPNRPRQPGDWLRHFREKHGLQLDPSSVHDRKKAWPIFSGWCNAGLTLERVDAAVAKALAEATEPIAFLPGYVDRVIASQAAPQQQRSQSHDRNQQRAATIAALTGRSTPAEDDPFVIDIAADRVG